MTQINLKIINQTISEVRRFAIDENKSRNFEFVKQKIQSTFPGLSGSGFKVFWKDADGDQIRITDDEDLKIAFSEMQTDTKVLYVVNDYVCPFADASQVEALKGMAQQYLEPLMTTLGNGRNDNAQAFVNMLRNAAEGFFSGKNNNPETEDQSASKNVPNECKIDAADLKVKKGLEQLREMGFDDDNGFLKQMLQHFDGNVESVLRIITK